LPVTVSPLAIAPVKGMRLQRSTEIQLGHHGVTGDREFLVVDDDCRLLLTGSAKFSQPKVLNART
jgi:uncharacterized protein YcbX